MSETKTTEVPRPLEEWHEDDGAALWWKFPVEEAPYVGSPLNDDFPDYVTHWTSIPIPEDPTTSVAPSEPAEMAVVFHGRCPACGEFPDGDWSNIGSFTPSCGHELEAELSHDKDGAAHWSFTRVVYVCDGCEEDVPAGDEHACPFIDVAPSS